MHTCRYMYRQTYMNLYIYACQCLCTCVCMFLYVCSIYAFMSVCKQTCRYVKMCIHTHITYIHAHIHVYVHVHIGIHVSQGCGLSDTKFYCSCARHSLQYISNQKKLIIELSFNLYLAFLICRRCLYSLHPR